MSKRNRPTSASGWRKLRKAVLTLDNFECVYCGSNDDLTLDHLKPRSKGGVATVQNLVTACGYCNRLKGDMTPKQAKMFLLYGRYCWFEPLLRGDSL